MQPSRGPGAPLRLAFNGPQADPCGWLCAGPGPAAAAAAAGPAWRRHAARPPRRRVTLGPPPFASLSGAAGGPWGPWDGRGQPHPAEQPPSGGGSGGGGGESAGSTAKQRLVPPGAPGAPAPGVAAGDGPSPAAAPQPQQQPQQQQQQHQQQRRPFWLPFGGLPCPASTTATTAAAAVVEQQAALRLVGGLGRHIHKEAAKVAGVVGVLGAQLLLNWSNVQRAAANGGEALAGFQPPWAGGGLRLPWAREGGGGGGGAGGAAAPGAAHSGFEPAQAARRWMARGVEAERALDLREALSCYQNAVALEPANVEYVCRLAKQWSDLTYEAGARTDAIVEANTKAIEYAERAVALAPKAAAGHMALCVSRGRLALFSDNKTKVRLAKEAREAAVTAMALEPSNDLAHHLMGRWHFEMAQINFVVRQLIRLVYGASLAPGTFADALEEYQTAVALNPTKLIHRVELGRTYLRLGRRAEALRELQASVELDVEDVNARLQKDDAALMLHQLRREFARAVVPLEPGEGCGGGAGGGGGGAGQAPPAAGSAGAA